MEIGRSTTKVSIVVGMISHTTIFISNQKPFHTDLIRYKDILQGYPLKNII